MARYLANDSSDDDFSDNLQLAERLRIHRENKNSYNRKKNIIDDHSSSSSSLEMQHETRKNNSSRSYSSYNKKRQNGDKSAELLANPKRTCLRNKCLKSPDNKNKEKSRIEHYRHSALPCDSSDSPNRHIFADRTYEDHIHNLTKEEIPVLNGCSSKQHLKRKIPNGLSERLKEDVTGVKSKLCDYPKQSIEPTNIIKNQFPVPNSNKQFLWREPQNNLGEHSRSTANGIMKPPPFIMPQDSEFFQESPSASGSGVCNFVDSASDEDSRSLLNGGSLKGGRQSPELCKTNKKVLGRRINNKVFDSDDDSDDSDDKVLATNNRSKFCLVFSSSDSEVESSRKGIAKPQAFSEKTTNSFSINNGSNDGFEIVRNLPVPHSSRDPSLPGPSSSPVAYHSKSPRFLRNRRQRTIATPSEISPSSFHSNNLRRTVRARGRVNVGERYTRGSGSPHQRILPQQRGLPNCPSLIARAEVVKSTKGRSLTGSRSRRCNLNLASTYPDLFDAEGSSEVEFFTANSYSDTETSAESFGGLTIGSTVRGPENNTIICDHSINIGSSEDEISVVFSSRPLNEGSRMANQVTRSGEPRRALGRRRQRGSCRHLRDSVREVVSLSPDPVEQVEQVENDERYARMLQAQFDSEVDPDYSLSQHSCSTAGSTTHNLYDIAAPLDTTSRSGDANEWQWFQDGSLSPIATITDFTSYGHNYLPTSFGNLLSTTRRSERSQGRRRGSSNESRNLHRLMEAGLFSSIGPYDHLFNNSDDNFETFLGIADLNGDVPRGLQKNEINRLPTRKFIVTNSDAGSSNELPHKRADLNKECQVCLNDYVNGDTLRILPCFHEFHTPCIDPWLKINHTCPVCRVVIDLEG